MLPAASWPLLGRTRELALLLDRLREAATGSAACVILVGDPGIGKTRLTQAFAEAAAGRGPGPRRAAPSRGGAPAHVLRPPAVGEANGPESAA
jgi:MoxR-like ATPase